MKTVTTVATLLLVMGGLNWGFYGFLDMDLVAYFLGSGTLLAKAVYGLYALSAVYKAYCSYACSPCHTTKGSNHGGCCSR